MAIQRCPACQANVRVPDTGVRLRVTCPNAKCGRRWFHPRFQEVSNIDFKCSVTGQAFWVKLSRDDPDARFTIDSVTMVDEEPPREPKAMAGRTLFGLIGDRDAGWGLLALPSPDGAARPSIKGWLSVIATQGQALVGLADQKTSRSALLAETAPVEMLMRIADEYDWKGFTCPCCSSDGIVGRCGCGFFGCQGTAEEKPGGKHWTCSCGWSGWLEHSMTTVGEKKQRRPDPVLLQVVHPALPAPVTKRVTATTTKALPAPVRQLPAPAKRLFGRK